MAIQLWRCQKNPPIYKKYQKKIIKILLCSRVEFLLQLLFCFWPWKLYFVSNFQAKSDVVTFTVSKQEYVKEFFYDSFVYPNRNSK